LVEMTGIYPPRSLAFGQSSHDYRPNTTFLLQTNLPLFAQ
jgi:hypothetical protein